MPEHQVHDIAVVSMTVVATPIVGLAAHALSLPGLVVAAGFAVGGLSGLLLTPDLDVDSGCYSMQWMRKLGGPALGAIWQWYWWPYSLLFAHRGLSHAPVVGTATRVVYALPWLLPLLLVMLILPTLALGWIVGLTCADVVHTILDRLDRAAGGAL